MNRRTDSKEMRVFRSDRFFSSNGQWYFTTREKAIPGPFRTHDAAEAGLREYLMRVAGIMGSDPWDRPGAAT